jgi:hypothetical protein
VVVEERNFAELAGEFACDDFRERHEASLRVGRHVEAALERSRAVSSADPGAEHEGVAAVQLSISHKDLLQYEASKLNGELVQLSISHKDLRQSLEEY